MFIEYFMYNINIVDIMLFRITIPNKMSINQSNVRPHTKYNIRGRTLNIINWFTRIAEVINMPMYINMQAVIDNILRFTR